MDEKSHTLNINIKKSRTVRQEQLLETGGTVSQRRYKYIKLYYTPMKVFFLNQHNRPQI